MARTVVGVLRGGTSNEYDLSLKTGARILNTLPESEYDTRDILIDRNGAWYARGMPVNPPRALQQVDVVLSGLHGGVGEDGTVQRLLDSLGVPYAGSMPLPSALSLNKIRAVEILRHAGIRTPRSLAFSSSSAADTGAMARAVFAHFGPPYIVKPSSQGASHGIAIAASVVELPHALGDVLDTFGSGLVEEFLVGEDASVGVIDDFRGEEIYALPPVHIVVPDSFAILHSDHHQSGGHQHIVPSEFQNTDKKSMEDMAKQAHRALGLSDFSRADFIVTKHGPYLLEVNSIPGLHEHASLPHMLESVGSSVKDFLTHAVELSKR